MAPPKKVSTVKAAPAAVGSTTAAGGDSQAPKDKMDLQQAPASSGAPSTGAPSGAASTDAGAGAGAAGGMTGSDPGGGDESAAGNSQGSGDDAGTTGADGGGDATAGAGAAGDSSTGTSADSGTDSGQGGEGNKDSAAADPATLADPGASDQAPLCKEFGVVIRNHGSHTVNAGPGLQLLPCSTTPIPKPMDADDLELLRSELVQLERDNCLRPDTLTADVTKIMEIKA